MDLKLLYQAIIKYLLGLIIVGVLIFLPAGTINYWNGFLLILLLFIPIFIVGFFLMIKNPELLKKRLNYRETETEQKKVILYSSLMFLSGFIIAGLNYRYNWIKLPYTIIIASSILFLIGYFLYIEVLRENTYLSRIITVEENQKIIDTGLYSIIRHPMYASSILLFLTIPLILGSIISFIIFLSYPLIIAKRIKNEEEILEKNLVGYSEYKKKVKYKIIPFIW
ncbi:MAG: isoprenylcysteine carboxylmethyltransferase family protein [Clostridia bacterium]|nr:isoprenylcysteine carboxylmethyltransferase family protein [Clostridia bacterium]